MKISFLGDISLNNRYNTYYTQKLNPFENVSEILEKSDLVVGNLECLAEGPQENILKRPRLKTRSTTLNFLSDIKLNVSTLAHNHVFDNRREGFENTIQALADQNISHLGAGIEKSDASKPLQFNKDANVAFLNYVTHDTNPNLPCDADVHVNLFEIERLQKEIQELKSQGWQVFLLLHWGGGAEGRYFPDWEQTRIGRQLIDFGADLIVGHHSHTLQPFEVYKGKYIFYSLGNFCFDDVEFEGRTFKIKKPSGTESAILNISISEDLEIEAELIPINKDDSLRVFVDWAVLKKFKFRQLIFKIIFCSKICWSCYFFFSKTIMPIINYFKRDDQSLISRLRGINKKRVTMYFSNISRTFFDKKN